MADTMDFHRATRGPGAEATRRPRRRTPLWVRVSVIVGAVLGGVLLTTMLVAGTGIGERSGSNGRHGSGTGTEMDDDGPGRDHGSDGDHGSGRDRDPRGEHSGGDHGSGEAAQ